MKNLFIELRTEMMRRGFDRAYVARKLNMSVESLGNRFTMPHKSPWRLDECYKLIQLLGEDPSNLYRLFPPNGLPAGNFFKMD